VGSHADIGEARSTGFFFGLSRCFAAVGHIVGGLDRRWSAERFGAAGELKLKKKLRGTGLL